MKISTEINSLPIKDYKTNGDLVSNNRSRDFGNLVDEALKKTMSIESLSQIPDWVHEDYFYDPNNPRKPNMREMMEAISGKRVEELYEEPQEAWNELSLNASETLYGVVGLSEDTRDWEKIMNADNVLTAARKETAKMYEPKVDIGSKYNLLGEVTEQFPILNDKNGSLLRILSNDLTDVERAFDNFGITKDDIPENITDIIGEDNFSPQLMNFMLSYPQHSLSATNEARDLNLQTIFSNLSEEIPIEQLEKL